MRWYYFLILLVPALLLAAAVLFWPDDPPPVTSLPAPAVLETPPGPPPAAGPRVRGSTANRSVEVPVSVDPTPTSAAEADAGLWRLSGRVQLIVDGINVIQRLSFRLGQSIYALGRGPEARLLELEIELDREGRFSFEISEDDDDSDWERLSDAPEGLMWEFPAPGAESRLAAIAESESELTDPPEGLVRPRRKGRVLDFGVIRHELGGDFRVGTGRLLTADGAPVSSTARHRLVAMLPDDDHETYPFVADAQGSFVALIHRQEDVVPESWRLRTRWTDDSDELLALASPIVRGQVLDFGEIRIPGAVVEVRVRVHGAEVPGAAGEPFLAAGDEDAPPVPCAVLTVDTWRDEFEVLHPLAATVTRLVLPPSRYNWSCEMRLAPHFARPARGTLVVRPGTLTRLDIEFSVLPTIPVRTLGPGDEPLDCQVWATVAAESDYEWHVGLNRPPLAPIVEGFATKVYADHDRYGRAEGTARTGDTELLLRFTEQSKPRARLQIHLPALHPALGLAQLRTRLQVRGDDDEDSLECTLGAEPSVTTMDVNPSATLAVALLGGQAFGYPGGLFCAATVAPAGEGEHQVVLPSIGPPPWGMPAGVVRASLMVGDSSVRVSGRWRYPSRTGHDTLYDGEELANPRQTREGDASGVSMIPQALLIGGGEIPMPVTPPSEPWGEATAQLHLPVRIKVRVTRAGTPEQEFEASAQGQDGLYTSATAREGVAMLWAPVGIATVQVSLFDLSLEPRTVTTGADGVVDVHFEIDTVRVNFKAAGEGRQPDWALMRMTPEGPVHVDYVSDGETGLYPKGRYRVVPDPPYDPSRFVEFDLTDGVDRVVELPGLEPGETGSVLLRLNPQDMEDVTGADLMYYTPRTDRSYGESWSYAYSYVGTDLNLLPDAIEVRGLPKGQRVFLRGVIHFKRAGSREVRFLAATEVLVEEGFSLTPLLRPAREAEWLNGSVTIATRSELPGYWLPLVYDEYVAAGTHEIIVLDGKYASVLQTSLSIPPAGQEIPMPDDLAKVLRGQNDVPTPDLEPNQNPTEE